MSLSNGRQRVVICNVNPEIDNGRFPIKAIPGETITVKADIFADSHDLIRAEVLSKNPQESSWSLHPMKPLDNDIWQGSFTVTSLGIAYYTFKAWIDHFRTWQHELEKKYTAGEDIGPDIQTGILLIEDKASKALSEEAEILTGWAERIRKAKELDQVLALTQDRALGQLMAKPPEDDFITNYPKELPVLVERKKAIFSSWYEFFPRSWGKRPGEHGTFQDCQRLLPEIARMGFDVVYLPPIHPIGLTNRKGKNNSPECQPDDPGSPWAIGSSEGGHTSVHPRLGSLEDFHDFQDKAREYDLELALDLTFQCSMDHPLISQHPEWFLWRSDGTIRYAENPPKKYQDVVHFHFESQNWPSLWDELKGIVLFWIKQGIRIFRVDNPHTKPLIFWEWLIREIKADFPEVIFLAEAFTRPKIMYRLAKIGFSQSYTYFTWRNSKQELMDYVQELAQTEIKDFFRPNFWPNTPDILPEYLQFGDRPAFIIRLILAATLSSNYGIYGPAFELCITEALPGSEEYRDCEKYQFRQWDWDSPGNLKELISKVNQIRRTCPALQETQNIEFYESSNEYLLFYGKATADLDNILLIVVNVDPFHTQSGQIRIPIDKFGISPKEPYLLYDLLGEEKYAWCGQWNEVSLNPHILPAHIFYLYSHMHREQDFDYFM